MTFKKWIDIKVMFLILFLGQFSNAAIEEISEGVLAAEGQAPSGAKIYFGMEIIDKDNYQNWRAYANAAAWLTRTNRGILPGLMAFSNPTKTPPSYDSVRKYGGFSEDEYAAFIKLLKASKSYQLEKRLAVESVSSGVIGFLEMLQPNPNVYVAYISKKPVRGRFPFPKSEFLVGSDYAMTLKNFSTDFNDIIMCMTVTNYKNTPLVEHRGIFRNPMDFIDVNKTYSGVAIKLHSFAAAAVFYKFEDELKQYVQIIPTKSMENILVKNIPAGHMFVGTNKRNRYPQFPPIVHESSKGLKIAFKGVDVTQYPDDLPLDKIQFSSAMGYGLRRGGLENTVFLLDLHSLTRMFYELPLNK